MLSYLPKDKGNGSSIKIVIKIKFKIMHLFSLDENYQQKKRVSSV
jgi:hypothetical protein